MGTSGTLPRPPDVPAAARGAPAVGGSGDDVIGLGGSPSSTLIEHYNGTAWSIVPSPSPGTDNALTGVTESSATDLWAVGYDIPTGAAQAQTLTLNWSVDHGREPGPGQPQPADVGLHHPGRRDRLGGPAAAAPPAPSTRSSCRTVSTAAPPVRSIGT